MEKFRFIQAKKTGQLPNSTGVYCFKAKGEALYIGKAGNIKKRVGQHKNKNWLWDLTEKIGYIETNSEIDALLLESRLIKQKRPKHNVVWKDDKNHFYVVVTKEKLPRVFIGHQASGPYPPNSAFVGPFVEGKPLKETLKHLRKIFPYYALKNHQKRSCTWCQLKLCPGPNPNPKDYKKNIDNLIKTLKGQRQSAMQSLAKEMKKASQSQEFEKAARLRDKIAAFEKILSHEAVFSRPNTPWQKSWPKTEKELKKILKAKRPIQRIESYDISNIQGKMATGSMAVFINGEPDKSQYRKFKIRLAKQPNDIAMLKEVLGRRLSHQEWPEPDLVLIDGGKAQLNAGLKTRRNPKIKIIALAKKENKLYLEKEKDPVLLKNLPRDATNLILRLRDEAHRFAKKYHLELRKVDLLPKA